MKRSSLTLALNHFLFTIVCFPVQAQVSFFQPPTYSGSGNLFVADFNGDGKPDILTSDGTMNLGSGGGTFTLGSPVPGASLSVPVLAVADFNGDGKPDVLEQGMGTLLVLLGNGDGTFKAPISNASAASLSVAAANDLNGDGKADVIGVFGSFLVVYISKGDGTFAAGVQYNLSASSSVSTLLLGDVNGDGKTDVVVITAGVTVAGQELVLLGNGDGTFQTTPKTSIGTYDPQFAAVGDFNSDGKLDLAVGSGPVCEGTCTVPAATYLLLGNGDGTFQAPVSSIPNEGPIAAADLNGDGKLDLIMETDGSFAQIYLGNGDGTFSNASNYVLNMPSPRTSIFATGIAIADLNLDGKLDIALGNSVQLGNGDGTFRGVPLGLIPAPTAITAVAIGDFDKNGSTDVAITSGQTYNPQAYYVYILKNDGTGKLSWINTYDVAGPSSAISTGDFNGDGNLDLVVIGYNQTTQESGYSVLLGNGDGSFQSPVFYPQGANFGGTTVVADFNHDGKLDLAVSDGQSVAILVGNGDGTFATPVPYFDGGGGFLVTADFNLDGKLDLAAGGATGLLFGNGDGTFQPAIFPANLNTFAPVLTADFNNDGKPDLLSLAQVALGNGDGTFTLLPPLANGWGAVGDLNGDGRLDLVVDVNIGGAVQLGNGDGTFGAPIAILSPGNTIEPYFVADMNGDGRPDIIFALSTGASISSTISGVGVLINTTAPGFELSASGLSPGTVTAGSSATSTASVMSTFGFKGTVNLSCVITPAVTPGPTCNLSSSSVQISGNGTQTVTVKVGTTAPVTAATAPRVTFPAGPMPLRWAFTVLGSAWLWARNRKRLPAFAAAIVALALVFFVGCGGSGSSSLSTQTTPGTPAGTYTVTITASSGNASQKIALQVVVQ